MMHRRRTAGPPAAAGLVLAAVLIASSAATAFQLAPIPPPRHPGDPAETGWFDITGDVSLPRVVTSRVRVLGQPRQPSGNAECILRIDIDSESDPDQPATDGGSITLTARLEPGLAVQGYLIATNEEFDGMYDQERATPGGFFAEARLPNRLAIRNIGGTRVGGAFRSQGGRLIVSAFDGDLLELSFEVTLLENIPGTFDPRTIKVTGGLSKHVAGRDLGQLFGVMSTGQLSMYRCEQGS